VIIAQQQPAWYLIHAPIVPEERVKDDLEKRIHSLNAQDKIFQVVIPTHEVVVYTAGERRKVRIKTFPSYLMVQMLLDDQSWHVVRNTPGVSGFVGCENRPEPLPQDAVDRILQDNEESETEAELGPVFTPGMVVQIVKGPFAMVERGTIQSVNESRCSVTVLLSIFGRETPVELSYDQVAPLD
jgi:transcriptional antiterminator NusG